MEENFEDHLDSDPAPGGAAKAAWNVALISVTSEGGAAVAEETLLRAAPALASGVRRGVPFLGRRRAAPIAGVPSTVRASEFGKDLEEPVFVCSLAADPGGSRAMFALDGRAIAFLLEGMLGGDGSEPTRLAKRPLSTPQRAFIDRIAGTIVQGLSSALAKTVGLSLTKLPERVNERSSDGVLVQLPIEFHDVAPKAEEKKEFSLDDFDAPSLNGADGEPPPEEGGPKETLGTVVIAVSKNALNVARSGNQEKRPKRSDPRVEATLRQVEVDVVAELGRVRLSLSKVARLKVGDTLRLDVPVNADIDVRVADQLLFKGQPTTMGSQLAIHVVERIGPVSSGVSSGSQASEPPAEERPAASPLKR